tara:strand:+ start:960 stop:1823 length:864 start_codon:yes stop_codon:yes gene_type:complete
MNCTINPLTGRAITMTGATYKQLIKKKNKLAILENVIKANKYKDEYAEKKQAGIILQSAIRRKNAILPEKVEEQNDSKVGWEDLPDDVKNMITGNYYESMNEKELRNILKIKQDENNFMYSGYTKFNKEKLIKRLKTFNDDLQKWRRSQVKKEENKENKEDKNVITDLLFTYEDFDAFTDLAYGWGHTKQSLPLRKILNDFKGEEYVEGGILQTTKSERTRMMGKSKYDFAFKLSFKTKKYGVVEFNLLCDGDDKVLSALLRASGIDAYGESYSIDKNGEFKREEEE